VCQVASQLLAQPGVVTVLLADMESIARAAGGRYAESMPAGEDVDREEIGRRYLAKIVQLEIALPPPVPDDMRRVIREYGPSLRNPQPAAKPPAKLGRLFLLQGRMRASGAELSEHWQTLQQIVLRLRWWPLAFWSVGFFVWVGIDEAAAESEEMRTVDVVVILLFWLAVASGVWSRRLRKRARRKRDALKLQIEELKSRQLSPEQIEVEVTLKAAADPAANRHLISDLVSSSFLDSDEFHEVEAYIVDNPPALPREAKRSFNHAQLLTEIARARHMFGGVPVLTPAHLAKWLVLREQWPGLARAVAREPELLRTLEDGAEQRDPELVELLRGEPHLGDVIERLVHFQPAENGRRPA
jgi:hypothetical protein